MTVVVATFAMRDTAESMFIQDSHTDRLDISLLLINSELIAILNILCVSPDHTCADAHPTLTH